MDVTTTTAVIAIIGCIIGVAGFLRNASADSADQSAAMTRIETSLGYIGEDVKDTKAELRAMRTETAEAKQMASTALMRADAAHDRLDALDVPTAHESRSKAS